jgi:hypothetical protein
MRSMVEGPGAAANPSTALRAVPLPFREDLIRSVDPHQICFMSSGIE